MSPRSNPDTFQKIAVFIAIRQLFDQKILPWIMPVVINLRIAIPLLTIFVVSTGFQWGFFAHKQINRLAVFILPPEMIAFYKPNIDYITETAVNPDKRRMAVVEEGPRHYIDIDHYGDSALTALPKYWKDAVEKYGEDTLRAHGTLPWHIQTMVYRLKEAFLMKDPDRILRLSSELGHYVADAHVPLHTTRNYNGQFTGQEGIHGFWESRLPELFAGNYNFFVGKAAHISDVQGHAWRAIAAANRQVDSVLTLERQLHIKMESRKYAFEERGKQLTRVYTREYSKAYHSALAGMVEQQMRASVKMTGDLWYTAWVDAGQPDLKPLVGYKPTEAELRQRREEVEQWKAKVAGPRPHESPEN
jgi:hypothetical protein